MIWLHILAGALALSSGALAMAAPKGGMQHRRSGMVFVCSMLYMSGSGTLMAMAMDKPGTTISVIVGTLTFYLVSTAFLTVRFTVGRARAWITGFMLMALIIGGFAIGYGLEAMNSARGTLNGLPAAPYFLFGAVALLAASLDARLLMAGAIEGSHRLARHLWRMSFAMFIASFSFFLGQAKQFPEAVRESGVLAIPVVLVFLFLVYWVVRVFWRRRGEASRLKPLLQ